MARIRRSHRRGRGSIPRTGGKIFIDRVLFIRILLVFLYFYYTTILNHVMVRVVHKNLSEKDVGDLRGASYRSAVFVSTQRYS